MGAKSSMWWKCQELLVGTTFLSLLYLKRLVGYSLNLIFELKNQKPYWYRQIKFVTKLLVQYCVEQNLQLFMLVTMEKIDHHGVLMKTKLFYVWFFDWVWHMLPKYNYHKWRAKRPVKPIKYSFAHQLELIVLVD